MTDWHFDESLYSQYPRLAPGNHTITSKPCDKYNCVAWLTRDMTSYIEPGHAAWPSEVPEPPAIPGISDVSYYIELFQFMDYEPCDDGSLEDGFLKIAIYCRGESFMHVAKQLPNGEWHSKMSVLHDLRHTTVESIEDGLWDLRVTHYMRKAHDGQDRFRVELSDGIPLPSVLPIADATPEEMEAIREFLDDSER